MSLASSFVFAACRAGSERALKSDVQALHGSLLTPAYMRPQLITWKSSRPLEDTFKLDSVFARVSGLSLGNSSDDSILVKNAGVLRHEPLHLHVYPREHPEDGLEAGVWELIDARRNEIATKLEASGFTLLPAETRPKIGDWILDVVLDDMEGANILLGAHRHTETSHALPGALSRLVLIPEAPSRAFLKMEQALVFAGLDAPGALQGVSALELGCAPGGATLALLRRGAKVCGVDPGPMDPRVLSYAQANGRTFTHMKLPVGDLHQVELPGRMEILITDMNLAPPVVIHYLENIQRRVRARLLIVTLKLNDKAMETKLPDFLDRLRRFTPLPFRATQLPANRSEICIIAGKL
jgi:23S rRNA (cytidine2498-2'-O)-methyltransferase